MFTSVNMALEMKNGEFKMETAAKVACATDWVLILTILGTAVAIIGSIYAYLRDVRNDLKNDIERLDKRMDLMHQDHCMHIARTDKLYEMYVEIQKNMEHRSREVQKDFREFQQSTKEEFTQMNKQFYDLLKAQSPKTNP